MINNDEISPREVLDGQWLTGWEAVAWVEEDFKRHGIMAPYSIGQLLSRMAGTGYLPTISNDISHSVKMTEEEIGDPDDMLEEAIDARVGKARELREKTEEKEQPWQIVTPALWGAMFGFSAFSDRQVALGQMDWKHSSFLATFTEAKFSQNDPAWMMMNDPGFHIIMARNVLVYRDGLFAASRYAQGEQTDEDRWNYNEVDLSQLSLPPELPEDRKKKQNSYVGSVAVEALPDLTGNGGRGRPGGKNGEPIATLTIQLMRADDHALARYTSESAGVELQNIYALCGAPNRNLDNCRKDAAGILRAVREARR